MRAMFDPLYVYQPWSPARRARASALVRKRMAREARVWNRALDAAVILVRKEMTPKRARRLTMRIRKLRKEESRECRS